MVANNFKYRITVNLLQQSPISSNEMYYLRLVSMLAVLFYRNAKIIGFKLLSLYDI